MTPEQENEAVMKAAMLEWVMDALAGHRPCDFAESFVEVAAAQAARETLEQIAAGCSDSQLLAQNTLCLLGPSEEENELHG